MTKYLVYKEYAEPFYIEQRIEIQTLQEKIVFAKKLLSMLDAVQIEFWHAGSRYRIEFIIENTL